MPEAEIGDQLWDRAEAAVACDHRERLARGQAQAVRARERRVEHAEAVLAAFDAHRRPRLPVDEDDVAEQSRVVAVVEDQRAVGREHRVPDDQRHVVGAARQPEALLEVVVQLVLRRQSHVGVLRRDPDGVVVVPERARGVVVRVVVVLPLSRLCHVARIAVVLRKRGRPVQVRRRVRRVAERRMHRGSALICWSTIGRSR